MAWRFPLGYLQSLPVLSVTCQERQKSAAPRLTQAGGFCVLPQRCLDFIRLKWEWGMETGEGSNPFMMCFLKPNSH